MFSGGSNKQETHGLPADILALAEGYGETETDIYPDNAQTVAIFSDMLTQWRAGASGAIGLDYNVLPILFKLRRVKKKKREWIFDGVQIMERAALSKMRESND